MNNQYSKGDCICYYGTSRGDCGSLSISDGGKAYSKGWHAEAVHEKGNAVRVISGGSNGGEDIFSVAGETGESIELSQLNAETGESVKAFKEGLDAAAVQGIHVLADKNYAFVAAGNGAFHLYSFAKEKSICTLVSSSSSSEEDREVAGFAACLNDKFLVGAYAGTSQLDVWKFTRKATTKPQDPSCSIALPAIGKKGSSSIESCVFHHSEPLVAVVAAATKGRTKKSSKVYLYKLDLKVAASKVKDATTLVATIDCGGASSEEVASVQIDAEGNRLLIATETESGQVSFHTVGYDPENESQELSLASKPSSEKKTKKKRKQPETPQGKSTDSPAADANPQMANGKKSSEEEEDSRSLEARVSQMNINNKLVSGGGDNNNNNNSSNNNKLTADSAAVLLSQALQSSDKQLLEQCLNIRQEQVISNTIKQLRSDQVGKLVPLLVERINSSSTRAMQISCWIRHVVRHHLTYIISAPSIKGHLSVLYQHLEERQSSYNALLGLQGRLELLTTYIKSMRQQKQAEANGMTQDAAGGAGGYGDYYSDPAVVHVHESEDTETISLVPQIDFRQTEEEEEDEEMEDAASEEEEED